jgi:hypothetical protein
MRNYKREREINHKREAANAVNQKARRKNKACESDPSCTLVRLGGLYSYSRLFSLIRSFSVINLPRYILNLRQYNKGRNSSANG